MRPILTQSRWWKIGAVKNFFICMWEQINLMLLFFAIALMIPSILYVIYSLEVRFIFHSKNELTMEGGLGMDSFVKQQVLVYNSQ